jgi:hypothetical protein
MPHTSVLSSLLEIPVFTCIPMPGLPSVPQHFVDRVLAIGHSGQLGEKDIMPYGKNPAYIDRDVMINGVVQKSKITAKYALGNEWEDWVRTNITDRYYDTGARITIHNNRSTTGPHVDYPGKLRLFYLVDSGGPDTETVWYLRPGEPTLFDTDTWYARHGHAYCDNNVDELIELDRRQLPLNQWVLFNGYIRHGVMNQRGCRMYFDIAMTPDNVRFILEK